MKKILILAFLLTIYTGYSQKYGSETIMKVEKIFEGRMASITDTASATQIFKTEKFPWECGHGDTLMLICETEDSITVEIYLEPSNPIGNFNNVPIDSLVLGLYKIPAKGIYTVWTDRVAGLVGSMLYGRLVIRARYMVNGCVSAIRVPKSSRPYIKVWVVKKWYR